VIHLLTALLIANGAIDEQPSVRLIEHERFICLVRHIDEIIARSERMTSRSEPRIIDLRTCPPAIRQDLTRWPNTRVPPRVELTEAELRCIRANRQRPDRLVRTYGRGVYELRLSSCRRR
jgi:hypothetical protein